MIHVDFHTARTRRLKRLDRLLQLADFEAALAGYRGGEDAARIRNAARREWRREKRDLIARRA